MGVDPNERAFISREMSKLLDLLGRHSLSSAEIVLYPDGRICLKITPSWNPERN